MRRLFVALPMPSPLVDACLAMAGDCPAGWARQDASQLHLTLRFIGEVDRHQAQDIASALGHVALAPISLGIDGVGHFDQGRHGALFARAVPRDALGALHKRIDRAVTAVGLPPERRSYFPHVTLARFRRGAEDPQRWIERHAGDSVGPCAVRGMALYESHLGQSGASYDMVEFYSLPASGALT